ncbi:hypothetical protein AB1Y20_010330 [Prymnesium parvum]|uniref:Uncharacterized protein n=1 Tax=Prymnesium parvum TaxID=97485 RepID=A0AB34K503_PRYPA
MRATSDALVRRDSRARRRDAARASAAAALDDDAWDAIAAALPFFPGLPAHSDCISDHKEGRPSLDRKRGRRPPESTRMATRRLLSRLRALLPLLGACGAEESLAPPPRLASPPPAPPHVRLPPLDTPRRHPPATARPSRAPAALSLRGGEGRRPSLHSDAGNPSLFPSPHGSATPVVTVTLVADLDLSIEAFDAAAQANFTASLAAATRVNVSAVRLSISAASVRVEATITSPTVSDAETVLAAAEEAIAASNASGAFLGFAVTSTPAAPTLSVKPAPPLAAAAEPSAALLAAAFAASSLPAAPVAAAAVAAAALPPSPISASSASASVASASVASASIAAAPFASTAIASSASSAALTAASLSPSAFTAATIAAPALATSVPPTAFASSAISTTARPSAPIAAAPLPSPSFPAAVSTTAVSTTAVSTASVAAASVAPALASASFATAPIAAPSIAAPTFTSSTLSSTLASATVASTTWSTAISTAAITAAAIASAAVATAAVATSHTAASVPTSSLPSPSLAASALAASTLTSPTFASPLPPSSLAPPAIASPTVATATFPAPAIASAAISPTLPSSALAASPFSTTIPTAALATAAVAAAAVPATALATATLATAALASPIPTAALASASESTSLTPSTFATAALATALATAALATAALASSFPTASLASATDLLNLYEATGGDNWFRRDNWTHGDPCTHSWYGITCCPLTHPYLADNDVECLEAIDSPSGVPIIDDHVADPLRRAPLGCHSGWSTGNASFDSIRCTIVRVALGSNNLRGEIRPPWADEPHYLCALHDLQKLDLSNNRLHGGLRRANPDGSLAACAPRLRDIDLSNNGFSDYLPKWLLSVASAPGGVNRVLLTGNRFIYPTNNTLAALSLRDELEKGIVRRCRQPAVECSGLPFVSCEAFGTNSQQANYTFVPSLVDPTKCQQCDSLVGPFILVGSLAFLTMLTLFVYVYLVGKYPEATQQWVATFSIVMYHANTLSIIGDLRLEWPSSVNLLTNSLSFGSFLGVEFVNPECLLKDLGVSAYFLFSICRAAAILCLMFGAQMVQAIVLLWKHCCSSRIGVRRAPRSARIGDGGPPALVHHPPPRAKSALRLGGRRCSVLPEESSRCSLTFAGLTKMASRGVASPPPSPPAAGGEEPKKVTDKELSLVDRLEFAQTIIFSMQVTSSWRIAITLIESEWTSSSETGVGGVVGSVVAFVLLGLEVVYIIRYILLMNQRASTGSWGKMGLTRAKLSFRLSYFVNRYAAHAPWWQFLIWVRQLLLTFTTIMPEFLSSRLVAATVRADLSSADQLRAQAELDITLLWIHAAVAVLIFAIFWAAHVRWQPYVHRVQNVLESWLFFSDIVIVGLGCAYTVLFTYYDGVYIPSLVVEVLIVSLCAGSLVLAIAYFAYEYRQAHKREADETSRQQRRDEYMQSAGLRSAMTAARNRGAPPPFPLPNRLPPHAHTPPSCRRGQEPMAAGLPRGLAGPSAAAGPLERSRSPVSSGPRRAPTGEPSSLGESSKGGATYYDALHPPPMGRREDPFGAKKQSSAEGSLSGSSSKLRSAASKIIAKHRLMARLSVRRVSSGRERSSKDRSPCSVPRSHECGVARISSSGQCGQSGSQAPQMGPRAQSDISNIRANPCVMTTFI